MTFRDKFTRVERRFTPLYQAHHGEYRDGRYDVEDYWSASIEGVPEYDPSSPSGARLRWRCILAGKSWPMVEWMTNTIDEAFASLEKETTRHE